MMYTCALDTHPVHRRRKAGEAWNPLFPFLCIGMHRCIAGDSLPATLKIPLGWGTWTVSSQIFLRPLDYMLYCLVKGSLATCIGWIFNGDAFFRKGRVG